MAYCWARSLVVGLGLLLTLVSHVLRACLLTTDIANQLQHHQQKSNDCPCAEFGTIESIAKVQLLAGDAAAEIVEVADAVDAGVHQKKVSPTDDDTIACPQDHKQQQQQRYGGRYARLLAWLSSSPSSSSSLTSEQPPHGNIVPCPHRVNASLSILNAIRHACQPFLNNHQSSSSVSATTTTSTTTTTTTPLVESSSSSSSVFSSSTSPSFTMNENAFPSLASSSTTSSVPGRAETAAAESRPVVWNVLNKGQQQPQQASHSRTFSTPQTTTLKKPKRRIRPASISLQVGSAVPASGPWGRGNSSSSPSNVVGSTIGQNATLQQQIQQQPGGKGRPDILEARMHDPNMERHNGNLHSIKQPLQRKAMEPPAVEANLMNGTTCKNENTERIMPTTTTTTPKVLLPDKRSDESNHTFAINSSSLNRLVQAYCILIEHYLVPSTALELHLLLRLLAIPVAPAASVTLRDTAVINQTNDDVVFGSMFSSPAACVYFAKHALERLSDTLCGLGLVQYLVTCPPFQQHCPDVTREFKALLLQQEQKQRNKVTANRSASPSTILWKLHSTDKSDSSTPPKTALLTQSFNHARDSRHHYRSRPHQILYNNREECRDSFLFQLRSFLHVRGGGSNSNNNNTTVDDEALVLHQIQTSSRMIIDQLLDANLAWFTEFFCDLLLQIGSIPHQETDKDVLRIAGDDQDKLAKLHKRLSSKTAPTNKSSKKVVADAKRRGGSTPRHTVNGHGSTVAIAAVSSSAAMILDAQQAYFSGHQEFFFLFMVLADSYKFGLHLRSHLIAKMKELVSNLSTGDILESKLPDMQLVLTTDRGVFGYDRVDSGTKLLLLQAPAYQFQERAIPAPAYQANRNTRAGLR